MSWESGATWSEDIVSNKENHFLYKDLVEKGD